MIKVNGVKIKEPKALNITRYKLTKSGRVANGDMTMDLVAKKFKLILSYEVISGRDFQKIIDLVDGTKMFFEVQFTDIVGQIKTITCYCGDIPYDKFRHGYDNGLDGYYWRNVEISLIER